MNRSIDLMVWTTHGPKRLSLHVSIHFLSSLVLFFGDFSCLFSAFFFTFHYLYCSESVWEVLSSFSQRFSFFLTYLVNWAKSSHPGFDNILSHMIIKWHLHVICVMYNKIVIRWNKNKKGNIIDDIENGLVFLAFLLSMLENTKFFFEEHFHRIYIDLCRPIWKML